MGSVTSAAGAERDEVRWLRDTIAAHRSGRCRARNSCWGSLVRGPHVGSTCRCGSATGSRNSRGWGDRRGTTAGEAVAPGASRMAGSPGISASPVPSAASGISAGGVSRRTSPQLHHPRPVPSPPLAVVRGQLSAPRGMILPVRTGSQSESVRNPQRRNRRPAGFSRRERRQGASEAWRPPPGPRRGGPNPVGRPGADECPHTRHRAADPAGTPGPG